MDGECKAKATIDLPVPMSMEESEVTPNQSNDMVIFCFFYLYNVLGFKCEWADFKEDFFVGNSNKLKQITGRGWDGRHLWIWSNLRHWWVWLQKPTCCYWICWWYLVLLQKNGGKFSS